MAVLCVPAALLAQKTIIYCGKLIDPASLQVRTEMSVVVTGNTISDVQKGYISAAAGDKVIDLKSRTVMPGLIDAHVHLENETSPNAQLKRFTQDDVDIAFQSTIYAKTTLMTGFTTVRDVGGTGVNISLRNAIRQGVVIGPRVYTAGKILSSTGGHGDPTHGWRKGLEATDETTLTVVDGKDACIKAVRQMYKKGADLIKITASGGVLSLEKDGTGPQFSEEEIRAIVETAKDYGMRVAAHAHGAEAMKRAAYSSSCRSIRVNELIQCAHLAVFVSDDGELNIHLLGLVDVLDPTQVLVNGVYAQGQHLYTTLCKFVLQGGSSS